MRKVKPGHDKIQASRTRPEVGNLVVTPFADELRRRAAGQHGNLANSALAALAHGKSLGRYIDIGSRSQPAKGRIVHLFGCPRPSHDLEVAVACVDAKHLALGLGRPKVDVKDGGAPSEGLRVGVAYATGETWVRRVDLQVDALDWVGVDGGGGGVDNGLRGVGDFLRDRVDGVKDSFRRYGGGEKDSGSRLGHLLCGNSRGDELGVRVDGAGECHGGGGRRRR